MILWLVFLFNSPVIYNNKNTVCYSFIDMVEEYEKNVIVAATHLKITEG